MAVYKPIKVTSLPAAPLAENAVYFVKGTTDTRIKMYVTDTSGTAFLVGITSENEVLSTLLNGFTVGSNTTIASSDSILGAFGKTQGQINALATVVNEGIKVPVPINCSTNPNYPASTKGDSYLVTVAGKIGGASGIIVDVGDKIICLTTNAGGTQASVGSNFYILESNFNILSIAKGGTNSSTALNNNRVMVSSSGSILEATAITANRALISNASGIPVHSSVTNTELGHLSGVTSAIQTQLNGKEPSFTKNTAFNKNFGTTAGTVAEGNDSRFHDALTLGTNQNGLSLVDQVLSLGLASTSTNGALSSTDWSTFNGKEPAITLGTTAQYFRGDKTFQDFATAVRASVLTGYTVGANTALADTDSVLGAFGKVQGQLNAKEAAFTKNTAFNKNFGTTAGTVAEGDDPRILNGQTAFSWGNHATAGYLTGTGTAGQVSFWTGANTQGGDSGLVWDNANKRATIASPNFTINTFGNLNLQQSDLGGINKGTSLVFRNNVRTTSGSNIDFSAQIAALKENDVNDNSRTYLAFYTSGAGQFERWRIDSNGILQSNGEQTIQTSTGALTLATAAGDGNIILSPHGTGNVGIGTTSPTRLLDVNGAMRLRAIAAPTTDLNAGDMYYDSATNRMRFRRTSDWVEMGMLWDTVEW